MDTALLFVLTQKVTKRSGKIEVYRLKKEDFRYDFPPGQSERLKDSERDYPTACFAQSRKALFFALPLLKQLVHINRAKKGARPVLNLKITINLFRSDY